MRAIHDSQAGLIWKKDRAVALRVLVATSADPHGSADPPKMVDLTPYSGGSGTNGTVRVGNLSLGRGLNWVRGVQLSDDKGEELARATITLVKRHADSDGLSISPFWPSLPNGQIQRQETGVLWVGRRIQVWTQLLPDGGQATPSDEDAVGHWDLIFDGYIDTVGMGKTSDNTITLTCRDLGAPLSDYWIYDRIPQTVKSVDTHTNDWYDDLVEDFAHGQIPLVAYTDHEVGLLNEIIANTYVRDNVTLQAPTYKFPTPTLYNEQDFAVGVKLTAWNATQDQSAQPLIPQQPLLQVLQERLSQFGWQCRYKWLPTDADATTGSFELQVYIPGRFDTGEGNGRSYDGASFPPSQPDNVFVLSPDFYDVTDDKVDASTIRNGVSVPYTWKVDGIDQYQDPGFSYDDRSRSLYGYRYMRCTEDATGMIGSNSVANLAAANMLKDLSRPWRFMTLDLPYMPVVELGDCIQLEGPNANFESDVWVVVDTVSHGLADGKWRTQLRVRQLFVYSDAGSGVLISRPFGTRPEITDGVGNNWSNGLHPRVLRQKMAVWGTAPTRNDAYTPKYNFAQLSDAFSLKDSSTPSTFLYINADSLIDPMGVVDLDSYAWAQWTCPTSAYYQHSLSAKVAPSGGSTYSDAKLTLQRFGSIRGQDNDGGGSVAGSVFTLTSGTPWTVNAFTGMTFKDSTGAEFPIVSNTNHTITVTGSPHSGANATWSVWRWSDISTSNAVGHLEFDTPIFLTLTLSALPGDRYRVKFSVSALSGELDSTEPCVWTIRRQ